MSFDEITALLSIDSEKQKNQLELVRLLSFFASIDPRRVKARKPEDLFNIEADKKNIRTKTREQVLKMLEKNG